MPFRARFSVHAEPRFPGESLGTPLAIAGRMLARSALALAASLSWTSVAKADPPVEDPFLKDPLLPTSIAVGAAGVTTAIAGALVWQSADPRPLCGALGCLEGKDNTPERAKGAALVGVGAGLAVASAAGLAFSLGAPLEGDEERDGPGAATAGLLLTSMSLGALGGGLSFGGAGASNADYGKSTPFFLASAGLAGIGIPLLIAGADVEDEAERREEADERRAKKSSREKDRRKRESERLAIERGEVETELKNPGMVVAGSVFLVAGVGGFVGCVVGASQVDSGGGFMDFSGLERLAWIGGAVASLGAGAGAGIPMVVIGSRPVPKSDASDSPEAKTPPPRLAFGMGTVAVEGVLW